MAKDSITIGGRKIGGGAPCYLIAEIGINHNGDVGIAKKLIDKAVQYGFDAVKFQKRTVEIVYSAEELARERESPFGATNGDLKRGLEFGLAEYQEIDRYCREKNIQWFCSPWDEKSVDFLEQFTPVAYKIASASLTDDGLLSHIKATKRPILLSTGMSTLDEIDHAVSVLDGAELLVMHTTSTYPSKDHELNLSVIATLRQRYGLPIGYSGHEVGVLPSVFAVAAFAACAVERHITLDRSMWGSDQAASLEPRGMELLARYIKMWPECRGDGVKRVLDAEIPIKQKLRRIG
jgi:N-acetylneuraminate synthase